MGETKILPADAEWVDNDPRWSKPAAWSHQHRGDNTPLFDRRQCPLIPLGEHVVLQVFDFRLYTKAGLAIPSKNTQSGRLEPVVLLVVSVGPDVKDFQPGDTVMANPRNQELAYEWNPDGMSPRTFLLMEQKCIIARLDNEVISQLTARAERIEAETPPEPPAPHGGEESSLTKPPPKKIIRMPGDHTERG